MDELLRIKRLAGLASGTAGEEPKVNKQSLMEALEEVIKTETIKAEVAISTGNKLLKELSLHTVQPIKKERKQAVMESAAPASSMKDKELLMKLVKESVKYKDQEGIKAQIATKLVQMMEKYGFTSPHELIIHFGGTVISNKDGNTITW